MAFHVGYTFHVGYWGYLGWAGLTGSLNLNTHNISGIYTPAIIIKGSE